MSGMLNHLLANWKLASFITLFYILFILRQRAITNGLNEKAKHLITYPPQNNRHKLQRVHNNIFSMPLRWMCLLSV